MKKFLFFTFILAFSVSLSAQTKPSVKVSDMKKDATIAVSQQKPNYDAQITKALMKDEGLQKDTIDYLKSNPETKKSLTSVMKSNKGSNAGMMKAILGDKKLSAAAIDYIKTNPTLFEKAMKLTAM
jgi:hypothetical protein